MSRDIIARGIREIKVGDVSRVRSKGSGRKKLTIKYSEIKICIEDIIESDTRGESEGSLPLSQAVCRQNFM